MRTFSYFTVFCYITLLLPKCLTLQSHLLFRTFIILNVSSDVITTETYK